MSDPVADELLVDAITRQLSLVRLQEAEVRSVLRVLVRSDAELRAQIETAIERRRENTPTGVRLRLIRSELRRILRQVHDGIEEALVGGLDGIAEQTVRRVADDLERSLPFAFSATRPDPGLLRSIATNSPFQGRLLAEHVRVLESATQQRLISAVEVGMTLGETSQQIARRVMGSRTEGGGALELSRHQAAALTRTAVQHVHAEARDALYSANLDVVGAVMAVVTLDERTCRICGPRDGLVWSLPDHRPIGHSVPWGAGPGRWHFQCRCTAIPVLREPGQLEEAGYDLDVLAQGERAALGAPVSSQLDYDDWLRRQPRSRREEILGKRRAQWWEDHPDRTLAAAWRERFGGNPVQPARAGMI